MTKSKKIFGIIIIFALVVNVFLKFSSMFSVNVSNRTVEKNTAKKVVLSSGTYTVGKEISPGFYDISAVNESVTLQQWMLNKGDRILAVPFYKSNVVNVEGKGKAELIPAKFHKLKKESSQYALLYSGYYLVGSEIPQGIYSVYLEGASSEISVTLFHYSADEQQTIDQLAWAQNNINNKYVINLKKEESFLVSELNSTHQELSNIKMIFYPMESNR